MTGDLPAIHPTSKPEHVARHERLLGIGAIAGLAWVGVQALSVLSGPDCPSTSWSGVPCAGCGMTRSLWASLLGHPAVVLRLHPASPLVLLAMVAHALAAVVSFARPDIFQSPRLRRMLRWLRWSSFVAVVIVGTLRALLIGAGLVGWNPASGVF